MGSCPGARRIFCLPWKTHRRAADKLAGNAMPPSLLRNALSESGFPRFLELGSMHVFAAAMPLVHPEAPAVHRVSRSPFVVVLTEHSVLLLNSSGPEPQNPKTPSNLSKN